MAESLGKCVDFLTNDVARSLYKEVSELPIVDYHCHLSPKEIYEDKTFKNIGEMWLSGDHYKWRLMRSYGLNEAEITGGDMKERFIAFYKVLCYAFGNPIRDWAVMELQQVFGFTNVILQPSEAENVWEEANAYIKKKRLSPRKLMEQFKVEYVATTDELCDNLEYHKLLAADDTFKTRVTPSFRVDKLLVFDGEYASYINKLSEASGIKITDLDGLESAISSRMAIFTAAGCRFSDVGVEGWPTVYSDKAAASVTFVKLLNGEETNSAEREGLVGYLLHFLGEAYFDRGMVMQLHLGAKRNSNSAMLKQLGRDSGFDCVGAPVSVDGVTALLDGLNSDGKLPKTIVYTLNPSNYYELITMCGAFSGVVMGVPWWFNDHKRGMEEFFAKVGELGYIGGLVGMLTDSRSFLSYVRHDYYRLVVCEYLSGFVKKPYEFEAAKMLAHSLCYGNAKTITD